MRRSLLQKRDDKYLIVSEVTQILDALVEGDPSAGDKLLPLVYEELRRLAAYRMANERPDHTLQPTALVHEAWIKLVGKEDVRWNGRAHFFGAAAEAMRRILINHSRRKGAVRHGGGLKRFDLQDNDIAAPGNDEQIIALSDALEKFAAKDQLKAELVKLRYFAGLSLPETAQILGISEPTAKRYWAYAKAWLLREMTA